MKKHWAQRYFSTIREVTDFYYLKRLLTPVIVLALLLGFAKDIIQVTDEIFNVASPGQILIGFLIAYYGTRFIALLLRAPSISYNKSAFSTVSPMMRTAKITGNIVEVEEKMMLHKAYHEAGHIVVGHFAGAKVLYATIEGDAGYTSYHGHKSIVEKDETHETGWQHLLACFGGSMGEKLNSHISFAGPANDYNQAQLAATTLWGNKSPIPGLEYQNPYDILNHARDTAQEIFDKNTDKVHVVAQELYRKRSLNEGEIRSLLQK